MIHYKDTHMSKVVVEVDPTWGGYQSCVDTEPSNCSLGAKVGPHAQPGSITIGDDRHVGRRRAQFFHVCGSLPMTSGQCAQNQMVGNWFSLPKAGACVSMAPSPRIWLRPVKSLLPLRGIILY